MVSEDWLPEYMTFFDIAISPRGEVCEKYHFGQNLDSMGFEEKGPYALGVVQGWYRGLLTMTLSSRIPI